MLAGNTAEASQAYGYQLNEIIQLIEIAIKREGEIDELGAEIARKLIWQLEYQISSFTLGRTNNTGFELNLDYLDGVKVYLNTCIPLNVELQERKEGAQAYITPSNLLIKSLSHPGIDKELAMKIGILIGQDSDFIENVFQVKEILLERFANEHYIEAVRVLFNHNIRLENLFTSSDFLIGIIEKSDLRIDEDMNKDDVSNLLYHVATFTSRFQPNLNDLDIILPKLEGLDIVTAAKWFDSLVNTRTSSRLYPKIEINEAAEILDTLKGIKHMTNDTLISIVLLKREGEKSQDKLDRVIAAHIRMGEREDEIRAEILRKHSEDKLASTIENSIRSFREFYHSSNIMELLIDNPEPIMTLVNHTAGLQILERSNPALNRILIMNTNEFLSSKDDINFFIRIINLGGSAENLLGGYLNARKAGVLEQSIEDKRLVLEFITEIRVLTPEIIKEYKRRNTTTERRIFIESVKSVQSKMVSREQLSQTERELPYYAEVLAATYPNNVGNWTNHESNDSAKDRSEDLAGFKIEDRYVIDSRAAKEIVLKEGEDIEEIRLRTKSLQQDIVWVRERAIYSPKEEGRQNVLTIEVDNILRKYEIDIDMEASDEEKIYAIAIQHLYGEEDITMYELSKIVMLYQFTEFEDMQRYINATGIRVENSRNEEYALLLEMHEFFAGKMKDAIKDLAERVENNGALNTRLREVFDQLLINEKE
ncbi:MAG: hypothetical protein Q9M91_04130 [Candidatus Dojkabacteria bacterium]|nr:hypothetical protein [Candidatus Dojkabacteria bacterium]MDQ7021002.1 hypothetical protein [Candidatus Dojkabacteria bacterium]